MATHVTDITENDEGNTVVRCLTENEVIALFDGGMDQGTNWDNATVAAFQHEMGSHGVS